jgi:hypothetical protein
MNNEQNDLTIQDVLDAPETEEQKAARDEREKAAAQERYQRDLMSRMLLRVHDFLAAPDRGTLDSVLTNLARYAATKKVKPLTDKGVMISWHLATCPNCRCDQDGDLTEPCDICEEYVHSLKFPDPRFHVEQVKD